MGEHPYPLLCPAVCNGVLTIGDFPAAAHGGSVTELGNQIFVLVQQGKRYPKASCDVRHACSHPCGVGQYTALDCVLAVDPVPG